MKSKPEVTRLKRWLKKNRQYVLIASNMVALIGLGVWLLVFTKAATPPAMYEAESGTLSSVDMKKQDVTASGGLAVRFGMVMDNNLGSFLYNSTLTSRYKQYETATEQEVEANITTRGNLEASPGGYQTHNSQGQFRFTCQYSHFNYDDPIVYPGQPGKAHLHMFWGNTKMDANTTDQNIMTRGGGSCSGYEANRTGYWMPAVLDGNNKVVVPKEILMYYKSAQNQAANTKKMPKGLKMIAGSSTGNTDTSVQHVNGVIWACYTGSVNYTYIGNTIPDRCPPNEQKYAVNSYTKQLDPNSYSSADTFPMKLNALIFFPACVQVDGAGKPVLDSVNHKSHVAYFNGDGTCPATHPYMMPQVSYHVAWPGDQDYSKWKLSSDAMAGTPDGFSLHADWYGGWTDAIQDQWIKGCVNLQLNCSNGVMAAADGKPQRQLKVVPDYEGPNNLTVPTK